jgi:hypothetical protein
LPLSSRKQAAGPRYRPPRYQRRAATISASVGIASASLARSSHLRGTRPGEAHRAGVRHPQSYPGWPLSHASPRGSARPGRP